MDKDVEDKGWGYLVCGGREKFLEQAMELPEVEKEAILIKFDQADQHGCAFPVGSLTWAR
jgi:hypothetical protein